MDFNIQSSPPVVGNVYATAFAKGMSEGLDTDEAERAAMRSVAHAGWYQTKQGWKQLGPDVREKVNLRKAEKQPDGTYVVRDVDVFYPNAVKAGEDGAPIIYTADDVRRRICNTNAAISHGGQAPALSKGHPHILQKANGIQLPAVGKAVNWRESPRKPGMARCDLVGVSPEVVENEWAKGVWTGLSAGLVSDANKTNERFGHVALLGVDSQALSHLPTTEVFSVDQCLFSADVSAGTSTKGNLMNEHEIYQALAQAQAAYATATASFWADEPGAAEKVQQTFGALQEAQGNFDAFCNGGTGASGASGAKADKDGAEKDGNYEGQEPQEDLDVPEEPHMKKNQGNGGPANKLEARGSGGSFEADIEGDYAAEVSELRRTVEKQNALIANFQTIVGGLAAKTARQEFSTFVNGLVSDGHEIDQNSALEMFSNVAGNAKAIDSLKKMLKASPKSKLSTGTVFGVDASSADAAAANGANFSTDLTNEVRDLLSRTAPGINLTKEDMDFAACFQSTATGA